MALTLSAKTAAEVVKTTTRPLLIVEIFFSVTQRYCSRETISFNNKTYNQKSMNLNGLDKGPTSITGSITFDDSDGAMLALALNENITNTQIKIDQLYGESPWTLGDEVSLFDGILDGFSRSGTSLTFNLLSNSTITAFSPRIVLGPPIANFLLEKGTTFIWNGEVIEIE